MIRVWELYSKSGMMENKRIHHFSKWYEPHPNRHTARPQIAVSNNAHKMLIKAKVFDISLLL